MRQHASHPTRPGRATYERIHTNKLVAKQDGMQLRGEDTRECPTLIGDDNENPLVSPPETPTSPPSTTRIPAATEGAIAGGRTELPRRREWDGMVERSPTRHRERPED
jgi:hypothetical protein